MNDQTQLNSIAQYARRRISAEVDVVLKSIFERQITTTMDDMSMVVFAARYRGATIEDIDHIADDIGAIFACAAVPTVPELFKIVCGVNESLLVYYAQAFEAEDRFPGPIMAAYIASAAVSDFVDTFTDLVMGSLGVITEKVLDLVKEKGEQEARVFLLKCVAEVCASAVEDLLTVDATLHTTAETGVSE